MSTRCKGCNQEIEEFHKVGNWLFCPACFDKLLNTPQPSNDSNNENLQDTKDAESFSIQKSSLECYICNEKISGIDYKKLGDWLICPQCYQELLPQHHTERMNRAEVSQEKEEPYSYILPNQKKILQGQNVTEDIIYPGTSSGKKCDNCGRNLVEGGYYSSGEKKFCPNCFYSLAEKSLEEEKKKKEAENSSTSKNNKTNQDKENSASQIIECDSCGRKLPLQSLQMLEGFYICSACHNTNLAMSLNIAKKRHQKLMEQRMKEID